MATKKISKINRNGKRTTNILGKFLSIIFLTITGGSVGIGLFFFPIGSKAIQSSAPLPAPTAPEPTRKYITDSKVENSNINIVEGDQKLEIHNRYSKTEFIKSKSEFLEPKNIDSGENMNFQDNATEKINVQRLLKLGEIDTRSTIGFEVSYIGKIETSKGILPIVRVTFPSSSKSFSLEPGENHTDVFETDGRKFIFQTKFFDIDGVEFSLNEK